MNSSNAATGNGSLSATGSTEELIYSNDYARVTRRTLDDGKKIIVKQALGIQAIQRLGREMEILKRLRGIDGITQLADVPLQANTLALQDDGGTSLTNFLRSGAFTIPQLLDLALALAKALSRIHKAGVLHRDISPDNVLINVATRVPTLIDFNIAVLLGDQSQSEQKGELAGTLPYMSPEQTGRSGRVPDQRSDLYSLGVTLYEVATRRRPFTSDDVLELVHDHLVRIPDAPHSVNGEVPVIVSDVIMRLLEKEPDKRYQSADGLVQDLARIIASLARGKIEPFSLGQFDFGARLNPPDALIGRNTELAALREAFARASEGRFPCLLVSGPAGVGKSKLVAELKPLAAVNRAFCVFAKFDQYKQDSPSAALDGLQALARQLLAEKEEKLADFRVRLREALGNNLGVGPTLLPEFQLLLGTHEAVDISEAREAEMRTAQASLAILRAVSTADRPLVIVFDNMQWAPNVSLRILDAIVTNPDPIPGLLVVCAYRSEELHAQHPLQQQLDRLSLIELSPPTIVLDNFTEEAARDFVGAMLRLPGDEAEKLSRVLAERANGNPYNTIELINALRQDNLLVPEEGAWQWDAGAIHRHVGNGSIADLLNRRIGKLSDDAQLLLQVVACMGGELTQSTLELATGLDAQEIHKRLAPSLEDGLLMVAMSDDRIDVRFANGRVQQAVFEGMDESSRKQLHLNLARRLSAAVAGQPELEASASEQYLPAADLITDESELRLAVRYFDATARRLRLLNGAVAQKFLAAAVMLLRGVEVPSDNENLLELERELHRALFGLGRLDEVDQLYKSIVARADTPLKLAEPTRIQIYSFNNRRRFAEGMALGLSLLKRMGLDKPDDVRPAVGAGLKRLAEFARDPEKVKDFDRPEAEDPHAVAYSCVVPETSVPAFYADPVGWAWLATQAHRLWMESGPSRRLLSGISAGTMLLAGSAQDYRGAYEFGRHITAVGEKRNYQPGGAFARCMWAIAGVHWIEPLERAVEEFHRSRSDLVSLGDESFFLSCFVAFDALFDCAPTLDAALADVELGLGYASRSQNADFKLRFLPRRQLIFSMRGETTLPGSLENEDFDQAKYLASIDPSSMTAWTYHVVGAISALIFGDIERMSAHCAQAMPLNARAPGYYLHANLRVMQAIALCEKARAASVDDRAAIMEELDNTCLKWLVARAQDAPVNFLHLQRWVEAERAAVIDTLWNAGAMWDAAVSEAQQHERLWHRAVITERAARFHLYHGLEQSARHLFGQAFENYTTWGAAGKVKEMRRQHAYLRNGGKTRSDRTTTGTVRGTMVDTDMVDMMAVLRASQALSSETNLLSLTDAVGKVLGAITGATRVQLIVRADSTDEWVMARSLALGETPIVVEQASADGELAYSVFKYAERTAQVVVIDDLVVDERFNADPYAEKFSQCSMMMVPILKQGQLSGMLVLENEQRRSAFSADRLESVAMIAGQLSVSLDNALLYASLEKRVAERTAQLRQKTNDINAMLQNMPQGVLTVIRGNVIHSEYSAYLASILETQDIAGRNVMNLLFVGTSLGADAIAQVDAAIAACIGEDAMNYEFNSHLLPTEFDITLEGGGATKSLALSWSPIVDDAGTIDKLMICVRDVTELRRLEAEANARKRELQMIGEILAVTQEKFREFIDSAHKFVEENMRLVAANKNKQADVVALLFRNMHTIKGNARTYGLLGITNLVHAVEQVYDDLRKQEDKEWDAELLRKDLDDVRAMLDAYANVNDVVLGRKDPAQPALADNYTKLDKKWVTQVVQKLAGLNWSDLAATRTIIEEIGDELVRLGGETLHQVLAGTLDSLPSLAKELGKMTPDVIITDHGCLVRSEMSATLRNVCTHLLRNSIDHGLEKPELRTSIGKPAQGRIEMELAKHGDKIVLRLRDDGRGLAIRKLRARAVEQGLLNDSRASAEQVAQLIFKSGFSTAERITEVSGRGVGMDAVRGFLADVGGSIEIRFLANDVDAAYRAFETVIYLPTDGVIEPASNRSHSKTAVAS